MNKRVVGVVGAVLLAAVGTVLLVAFVRNAEERARADEDLVDVLVLRDAVEAGTSSSAIDGSFEVEQVPAKVKADDAIDDLSDVENLVASVDLVPGEQLMRSRFVEPGGIRRAAVPVPEGLLEVTVAIQPERTLGGLLKPGDTVAVIASFEPFSVKSAPVQPGQDVSAFTGEGGATPIPIPIDGEQVVGLPTPVETPNRTQIIGHNVLVTRLQLEDGEPSIDPDDENTGVAPTQELLVTLAMDAEGVEDVVFTKEFGRVWLALQPAGADTEGNPGGATRASVFEVQ